MRQNGTAKSWPAAVRAPGFSSDVYGFATPLQTLLHADENQFRIAVPVQDTRMSTDFGAAISAIQFGPFEFCWPIQVNLSHQEALEKSGLPDTAASSPVPDREGTQMRYKPRNVAALHIALGGLPGTMQVEADPDTGVSAKTVRELRKVMEWPGNLVITTPQDQRTGSAIKVSKASTATRVSPKP